MTFILAIKTTNGILVAADSLETQSGAFARWDDFAAILSSKSLLETDNTIALTPFEIKGIFKPERIKNKKGAQKIFNLTSNSVLLTAGLADINSKTLEEICSDIENAITKIASPTHTQINDIVFRIFNEELNSNPIEQSQKESCHHILCIREEGLNYIYSICYRKNINTNVKNYSSVEDSFTRRWIYMGGNVGMAKGGNELNNFGTIYLPTPQQAFRIASNLMSLSVLTEELLQEIPGVGGDVYYGLLTDKGFKFVASEIDAFNSLLS